MGNARQLGRAQAAAAFNLERAGGEGERGLRPLPLAGSDLPLPFNTRAPASAAPPFSRCSGSCRRELRAGIRLQLESGGDTPGSRNALESYTRHFPEESPRGGAVLAAACLAWLGFRGRARLLPSMFPSRSDERPSLGPAVRVKGLKRTASEFPALFRAQPANFPNMSHHRLFFMLRLIGQALREHILTCQALRLTSNRPQRADPAHATLKEKKTPVAFKPRVLFGHQKDSGLPPSW